MTPIARLYRFLASLKLAVFLLLALSAILAVATYQEKWYDAKTARHLVYDSPWFAFFLLVLGINVACSALIRYPWKKSQAAFLITHAGILVILAGSLVSFTSGVEGTMTLTQGETSDRVTVDEPSFSYQVADAGSREQPTFTPANSRTFSAEFRWSPPREGHEVRVPLSNGMSLVFDRYLNSATSSTRYLPGGERPDPAVHFSLGNDQMKSDHWLAFDTPDHHELALGPAKVRLRRVESEAALKSALAGPPKGKWAMEEGILIFELAGGPQVVPVQGNEGKVVPVTGSPYSIRIERYLPFAVVQDNKLVNRSPEKENPCVELSVLDGKGEVVETRYLFARFPQFSQMGHKGKKRADLAIQYTFDDPAGGGASLDLVVGPDDKLYYRATSKTEATQGPVALDKDIPIGWGMGFKLKVTEFVPRAVPTQTYEEFKVPKGKEGPPPAVRFRLEGADKPTPPGPYWLAQSEQMTVVVGKQALHLRYHLRSQPLGFSVKLVDFKVGFDPGSRMPASYTSQVQVDDPTVPTSFPYTISMNEPLYYKGLSFFQASYSEMPGQAPISILQVARDPGTPLKYLGSLLLVVGMAIQLFKWSPRRRDGEADDASVDSPGEEA